MTTSASKSSEFQGGIISIVNSVGEDLQHRATRDLYGRPTLSSWNQCETQEDP